MKPRVLEPAEAAEQREDRARRENRGEHRERRADEEHEREAAHARGRDDEQHHGRDRRDDVRVDDRARTPSCIPGAIAARTDRPARTSSLMRSKMTMFASAATPNVRTSPANPGKRQRHVEEEDRRVQECRVDAEPDDRDDSEEAVEDEEEDRDEQKSGERGAFRLVERVLPEGGRDVRAVERLEIDRERTRLQHDRDVLRLADRLEALDLRPPAADAAGQARVRGVDLREGPDLAVEHDREVLRRLPQAPANPLVAGDLLELVGPATRELHGHDGTPRGARARVEVRARARELEILARHLGHVRRGVLEEVVVGPVGNDPGSLVARAHDRVLATGDDDHPLGHRQHLPRPGSLVRDLLRLGSGVERAVDEPLRLRVEDVEGVRRPVLRLCLDARQQVVQRGELDREALNRDRRPRERRLEVVELELRRLADDLRGRLRIADTR